MTHSLPFKLATIFTMVLFAEYAMADVLPGGAMPDTVSKALTSQHQRTTGLAPMAPLIQPEQKTGSPLGPEAEKIKFKLNGIVLEGNHVYSAEQLSFLYKKKVGQTISVADLFSVVEGITNYYRNNGYIISRAILPPQHVKNGVVKIQVIEGTIDKVDVAGKPKGAKCVILAYGQKIRETQPLKIDRMENYLLLSNEVPGTQVKAVLSPSKTKTGAADLTLMTTNRPVMGYVSYDNYGTRYIGPLQWTGNLGFNSWATSGDSLQLTMTKTTKGSELTYNDANYSMPVTDEGVRWLIGSTRAQTHPLFVLQTSDIDGINRNYYTGFQIPIRRTRTENLSVAVNFNYLDSTVNTFDSLLYDDHIRSLGIGTTYNFADKYFGANLIYADIRQGLPFLGYTSNTNPQTALTSRPGGRADYTKLDFQATRLQAISGPWSMYGLIKGQWAFNPLLASEQFAYGGSQLGRGYDVAELIGDRGLAGSLELRYDMGFSTIVQSVQLYTFFDGGMIWNRKVVAGVQRKDDAMSAGIGSRFYLTKYISGNVMWAQPISRQVAAQQAESQVTVNGVTTNTGNGMAPRIFFSIVMSM